MTKTKPLAVAKICSYCKHPYVKPCDGKDDKCPNKSYKDRGKKS